MYLFDNKRCQFCNIDGTNIEIAFCDNRGMITTPLSTNMASNLTRKLNVYGVSASYHELSFTSAYVHIPWSFTDSTRTLLHFTASQNEKYAFAFA